jgi:high-affinity Fe2+/Pb2+ permease
MTPGLVPGQVYVGLGVLGLALFCIVNGCVIVLVVAGVTRMYRKARCARAVLKAAAQSVDEALADPQVLAGFARLDAAVRGDRQAGEGV